MFTVTRVGTNRLDIEMSGKLDAGQMLSSGFNNVVEPDR